MPVSTSEQTLDNPNKAFARMLFDQGWGHRRIARQLSLPPGTVQNWTLRWVRKQA